MNFIDARRTMVDTQVLPNHVTDAHVIAAMRAVPRELFVPQEKQGIAYVDDDIEIADDRYLMEPMILARLLQVAQIGRDDVVLEVGGASGYATAVLSHIASTIVSIESDKALAEQASRTLRDLNVDNVVSVSAPLSQGYPAQAPYDVIFFNGAVADIPQAYYQQLAEGGRLIAVLFDGRPGGQGRAVMIVRSGDAFGQKDLFDAAIPLLPGFEPKPHFVF